MLHLIKKYFAKVFSLRAERWLKKRIPAQKSITLSAKNIFILPTGFGFAFLAAVVLIFLLGTNYNNNVILLLSYLLGSFMITTLLHSFYNLTGLVLSHHHENKGFAEQTVLIPVTLTSTKNRYHLLFSFPDHERQRLNKIPQGESQVNVPFYLEKRGMNLTGRLTLKSEYSFGLFQTWTHIDFSVVAIAYPSPLKINQQLTRDAAPIETSARQSAQQNKPFNLGQDDFYALTPFQVGQPLAHVAWKNVAKGQGWLSKQYQQEQSADNWLLLENMPSTHLETQLSMLCYLALDLHKKGEPFGLSLGNCIIEPEATNQQHLNNVLLALALFKTNSSLDQAHHTETGTNGIANHFYGKIARARND